MDLPMMITAINPMETQEKITPTNRLETCQLHISAGDNFFDQRGKSAGQNPLLEMQEIGCVAGRCIRGDFFLTHRKITNTKSRSSHKRFTKRFTRN